MSDDAHFEVRSIAQLARLALTDEEVATFQAQLEQIVHYVEQLNELDVEGVEPMAHAVDVTNVFREDEPSECLDPAEVLRNFPAEVQQLVQVPRIIE